MDLNYQKVCANLLKDLPQKMGSVIERRFGLGEGNRETLEAIGQTYGITRERVRQIEKEGFSKISLDCSECQNTFKHFNDTLRASGDLGEENTLLSSLGGDKNRNQVFFLLNLSDDFDRSSEDDDFHSFWTKDSKSTDTAKKVVNLTLKQLKKEGSPSSLENLFDSQKVELVKVSSKLNKKVFDSYLGISKKIQKNQEDQIGLSNWVEINPKGIKDKAYLVLKKEGDSLHFTKVASLIEESPYFSQKKIHTATVHNELIKDDRFVLVGRGLYALKEWGYEPGVVRDIISKVLVNANKPLTKEDILKEVLGQRVVKENTVSLNLQNRNYFLKDSEGRYTVKES